MRPSIFNTAIKGQCGMIAIAHALTSHYASVDYKTTLLYKYTPLFIQYYFRINTNI